MYNVVSIDMDMSKGEEAVWNTRYSTINWLWVRIVSWQFFFSFFKLINKYLKSCRSCTYCILDLIFSHEGRFNIFIYRSTFLKGKKSKTFWSNNLFSYVGQHIILTSTEVVLKHGAMKYMECPPPVWEN